MKYTDLILNKKENKTVKFGDTEIKVLQYLPISEKYDLMMITLQKAKEDKLYNSLLLDMYFHLNLVYLYSDIIFTEEDREDEQALYDTLVESGLLDIIINAIPNNEYETIFNYMNEYIKDDIHLSSSAGGVVSSIINDLPAQAQAMAEIINSFDEDKFQAVKDFATAANGGRPIDNVVQMPTN